MKTKTRRKGSAQDRHGLRAIFVRAGGWLRAKGWRLPGFSGYRQSTQTGSAKVEPGLGKPMRWKVFSENVPGLVVAFTGLAISAAGYLAVQYYYENVAKQDLDRQAAHHIGVVATAIERHVDFAAALGDLIADPARQTERWWFWEFSKEQLPYYPGVRALIWAPRVSSVDRQKYERKAREDGLFGFRVNDRDARGVKIPAGYREEYFPAYFIEPFRGNEEILGYDLALQPSYAAGFEQARKTGRMNVVPSVWLSGMDPYDSGILLIQPVHADAGKPRDIALEPADVAGFVAMLIQVGVMIDKTVDEFTTPAWLDLYLYDVTGGMEPELLYYRPSPLRPEPSQPVLLDKMRKGLASMATRDIGDRNWLIVVRPVPGTVNSGSNLVPQGIGIIGVLLTSLLFLYLISTHNRRRVIEATVTERTAELSATNTSLKNEVRQRRRVEHELRAAKDQAEIANRTKSEFLAMISHELRTPLNAILGFSEILSSEMFGKLGDTKYRGYAEDIMSSGEHLLGLINNILDLSKVEAREFELDDDELDMSEAIDEALRFVADKAKKMKISVKKDIPANLPLLRADARAIRQILINLLSNAVKFTPARGRVVVGAETGGNGSFVLSVSDTGIGIPADHIERVLQPFAQVDTSLARKFEGTGLGLPLTKSLVELHGGILELDSKPDQGTTVRVIFDRSRVVDSAEAAE